MMTETTTNNEQIIISFIFAVDLALLTRVNFRRVRNLRMTDEEAKRYETRNKSWSGGNEQK